MKDKKHVGFTNPPWTLITESRRTSQEVYQGWKQDQATVTVPIPELQEEDWDQELTFPAPSIQWEHTVNQATTTGESEADV